MLQFTILGAFNSECCYAIAARLTKNIRMSSVASKTRNSMFLYSLYLIRTLLSSQHASLISACFEFQIDWTYFLGTQFAAARSAKSHQTERRMDPRHRWSLKTSEQRRFCLTRRRPAVCDGLSLVGRIRKRGQEGAGRELWQLLLQNKTGERNWFNVLT